MSEMTEKREVFGVVWRDVALGDLTLTKPDAAAAIEAAQRIRAKGGALVQNVRAVHVRAGSDALTTLDEGGAE
jgi:hypothetical protein